MADDFPAQSTDDKTAGFEFTAPTTGYEDITVAYDQRSANAAAKDYVLQYSTDGTNFTDAGPSYTTVGNNFSHDLTTYAFDLSAISGLDQNAAVKFRIVSTFEPGQTTYRPARAMANQQPVVYSPSAGVRIDMFTVEGTPIPEPASPCLLALGGVFAMRRAGGRR